MTIKNDKIGIIGGGNMGLAIANGLIKSRSINKENISISSKDGDRLIELKENGFNVSLYNIDVIKNTKYIILAIKPYQIANVCKEISQYIDNKVVISVAAGYSIAEIEQDLGIEANKSENIYRIMPNTAIANCQSFTGISCNQNTNPKPVVELFDRVGETLILEESLLDAVTILSGSGIAFAFRFIRAAMQGGTAIGLKPDDAKKIIAQTMVGAASLILSDNNHPEEEIDRVTTPKGTTIAGLNAMETNGFSNAVISGVTSSFKVLQK